MKSGLVWLITASLTAAQPVADFRNIAAQVGLTQAFPNGGTSIKKYIIETTGSGIAFLDYDNDGYLDLFVVSGEGGSSRLYHNNGKGKFDDVTAGSGITVKGWGQGVCVGDFDNDGFTDILVTYWGQNALYRNIAGRRFEDVTARAHLTQPVARYNTGCAMLDYNRDGHLDLFIANYLQFDFATTPKPGANPFCYYRGTAVSCGPRGLPFASSLLYRNNGDGTFTDVSDSSGVSAPKQSYCLGVITGDFNRDGWPDIFVACDQTPSLLFINRKDGTFREEALLRGVALDQDGKALSGMGAAAADYDGDGWLDLFRTNFSDERETLYRNRGGGEFDDATAAAGLARNTRYVGWGCGFFDFDNDGWSDLMLVNGHVFPEVDRLKIDIHNAQRGIVYRNTGHGTFDDVSESAGFGILERHVSRGAAFGDFDNDGAIEIAINNQNEPPAFLKNFQRAPGNWVLLKLEGTRSNRSAIGAQVRLTAGDRTQIDEVRSGGSYLSQNDLRLHFGLAGATAIDSVEILWPSGKKQVERGLAVNRVIAIREKP